MIQFFAEDALRNPRRERERREAAEREGAGGSWTTDVRHFRGLGGPPRKRAFVRETSSERKIGCTRVEGEISSCKIFFS